MLFRTIHFFAIESLRYFCSYEPNAEVASHAHGTQLHRHTRDAPKLFQSWAWREPLSMWSQNCKRVVLRPSLMSASRRAKRVSARISLILPCQRWLDRPENHFCSQSNELGWRKAQIKDICLDAACLRITVSTLGRKGSDLRKWQNSALLLQNWYFRRHAALCRRLWRLFSRKTSNARTKENKTIDQSYLY